MIEIPYVESDKQRLELSGGEVIEKPNGMSIFQFDSKDKFYLFVSLGKNQK